MLPTGWATKGTFHFRSPKNDLFVLLKNIKFTSRTKRLYKKGLY